MLSPRANIIICALSFAILFSAYNTLQNFATSLFPGSLGNLSLGLLYAVAGVSVFAAPWVTATLGEKSTMLLGASCYVVYLVSLVWLSPALVIATSCVIGFGAAVLWVALGSFLTHNSTTETYAANTGLFWSIFQFNNVFGNLVTWAVLSNLPSSTPELYLGFAAVAGVGTLGLLFLAQPPPPPGAPPRSAASHFGEAVAGARRALSLLRQPRMQLLLPLFFFSGAELSFWTGEFPLLLKNGSTGVIGFVLTWAGVGEVVGGVLMGRLSDAAGRSTALLLATLIYAAALALSCSVKSGAPLAAAAWRGSPVAAFVAAFCFGVADAGLNATAYAMCSQLWGQEAVVLGGEAGAGAAGMEGGEGGGEQPLLGEEERRGALGAEGRPPNSHASVGAFSIFQLVQNAGSACWYGVSLWLPVHSDASKNIVGSFAQVYLQVGLLVFMVGTFLAVDRLTRRQPQI
jgi:MFS family permease